MMPVKCCILVLFLSVALHTYADETDLFGCNNTSISVGLTNSGVMNYNGQGIDPDLLQTLSELTHCTFKFVPVTRQYAFDLMEKGIIDLVPSVTREPHREAFAWFIPYYEAKFLLLTNANKLPNIKNLEQLKKIAGVKLARATGSGYGTYLNYRFSEMEALGMVTFYANYEDTIKALLKGEVNAAFINPLLYQHLPPKGEEPFPLKLLDVSPANATLVSLMLGKHRFSSAQIANWLRLIETLGLNGELQKIMEQHVSADIATSMLAGQFHARH
ncbi:transporter substrate-binding domain-containing protein [Marinomonas sp. A79]|uniref:Transporter substrate-binding domain-containing protein n=1 Tax=Marinomonas vulgaris TaxID=2823372 RepID=A0ABS5HB14_9GAMM|nr:transporter substrate-binding domain-containing protein [Marinomonas vulgaris]MBR7888838.1 transporter substrate-binding domain-containing protein [Marinomonas vulgaris]